jgi:uncharacterized protein
MMVVVDINHPAHVHYFKNFIHGMRERGHQVMITVTDKDVAIRLLDAYNFDYINLGTYGASIISRIVTLPLIDMRMYRAVRNRQPDIFIGFGSIRAAHVAYLLGKPSIILDDTEHSTEQIRLYLPFCSRVLTPSCFETDLGPKQIRFNGYMELAALHPNYFTPDPAVLDEAGLSLVDRFIIIRFVSWQASHDIGQHGIRDKISLVKRLEEYGRVLITSEGPLPIELEQNRIRVSPEKLHNLLYYATLYIGEGATVASECAVLGTHAIYVNTLRLGYTNEEGEKYDLVSTFSDPFNTDKRVIDEAVKLLSDPDLRRKGKQKREKLLNDKIDVTAFMEWFIENYPKNREEMEKHPEGLDRFGAISEVHT